MNRSYGFGEFVLEVDERRLLRNGEELPLPPKVFDTLLLLVEKSGHLVTKDEFASHLWRDTFVGDDTLAQNISILRKALGGTTNGQEFIITVPKRGYRFAGALREMVGPHEHAEQGNNAAGDGTGLGTVPKRGSATPLLRGFRFIGVTVVTGTLAGMLTYILRPSPKELKLSQLTANSIENPVAQSVISPDGKCLAFTDSRFKMGAKFIASDEMLVIPEPESLKGSSVHWEIAAWFSDSTRFLANARPANTDVNGQSAKGTSIWVVSLGGVPRKLRDEAEAFSVSPDGSWIAFGANAPDHGDGDREIWVMNPNGQEARRLFDTEPDSFICCLQWSQNQQRVIYLKGDQTGRRGAILSSSLEGGPTTTILAIPNLAEMTDFLWLADGRLIYSFIGAERRDSSLWELRTDAYGKPIGEPKAMTKFDGFGAYGLSVTSDGKTIAFTKKVWLATIYVADTTASGAHIASVKRLTMNDYDNHAQAWTPDGKSIIFLSHRNGRRSLFRHALDSESEEPLVGGANDIVGAAVSPDGSWLFYLDCYGAGGCLGARANRAPVQFMRVPLEGGTPQSVLATEQWYGRPRCAVSPAKLCIVAEQSEDGQPIIFSAFDALKGHGDELCRFEPERGVLYYWALSSDGTRIGILKDGDSRIHILHIKGQPPQDITVAGWKNLKTLFWSADGRGWFTSAKTDAGWTLLRVDLEGHANRVWEHEGSSNTYALPSPDGRHLAINAMSESGNIWTMKNF